MEVREVSRAEGNRSESCRNGNGLGFILKRAKRSGDLFYFLQIRALPSCG